VSDRGKNSELILPNGRSSFGKRRSRRAPGEAFGLTGRLGSASATDFDGTLHLSQRRSLAKRGASSAFKRSTKPGPIGRKAEQPRMPTKSVTKELQSDGGKPVGLRADWEQNCVPSSMQAKVNLRRWKLEKAPFYRITA